MWTVLGTHLMKQVEVPYYLGLAVGLYVEGCIVVKYL